MRGFWALVLVQFKLYLREPSAFFFTLAFPSLLLVLFGAIYGNEPLDYLDQVFGTVDASVPAYAGIVIGTVALISIPIDTATNRDNGVLRRYRATPLHPVTYLAAVISVYFSMMFVGMILLIVIGRLVFGLRMAGTWWDITAGFTLGGLAFIAIGFVLANLAATARIAQAIGMAFFFPMMFLSGAGLPLEILPDGIRRFSNFLPLTYVVRQMQGLWFGEGWLAQSVWVSALILVAILVVTVPIAVLTFKWQ
jgi:ABC-2 type transport system permease protein